MLKKLLGLLFMFALGWASIPTSVDPVNPFSEYTKPNAGVNLFSGDVAFEHKLIEMKGIPGFDLNLSLKYSSNVYQNARARNDIAPTGWVGLGWSFGYGYVKCDHKGTYTAEDDVCFYMSPEGVSMEIKERVVPISKRTAFINNSKNISNDEDRDNMPDIWEKYWKEDFKEFKPEGNEDSDGFTNLQEYEHRTNPLLKDTDGDGVEDQDDDNQIYFLERLPNFMVECVLHKNGYVNQWIVTNEGGLKFYYGQKENAEFRNSGQNQGTRFTFSWKANEKNRQGHPYAYVGNGFKGDVENDGFGLYPYQWDLVKVEDINGNAVDFSYQQELEAVHGKNGWKSENANGGNDSEIEYKYTKESYLKEIKVNGKTINFIVSEIPSKSNNLQGEDHKHKDEWYDPYEYDPEPDAFIEIFERKLLNLIELKDGNGNVIKKLKLCYKKFGLDKKEYKKSLLKNIIEFGKEGQNGSKLLHSTDFEYYETEKKNGKIFNYGALKAVKGPFCGTVTFDYEKKKLNVEKMKKITPEFNKNNPKKQEVPNVTGGVTSDGREFAVVYGRTNLWDFELYNLNSLGEWELEVEDHFDGFKEKKFGDSYSAHRKLVKEVLIGKDYVIFCAKQYWENGAYSSKTDFRTYTWDGTEWKFSPEFSNFEKNESTGEFEITEKLNFLNIQTFDNRIHYYVSRIWWKNNLFVQHTVDGVPFIHKVTSDAKDLISLNGNNLVVSEPDHDYSWYKFHLYNWDGNRWNNIKTFKSRRGETEIRLTDNAVIMNDRHSDGFLSLNRERILRVLNWNGMGWEQVKRSTRYDFPNSRLALTGARNDYFTVRFRHDENMDLYNWTGHEWERYFERKITYKGKFGYKTYTTDDYVATLRAKRLKWWKWRKDNRIKIYNKDRGDWYVSIDTDEGNSSPYKKLKIGKGIFSTNKSPNNLYVWNPDGTEEEKNYWVPQKSITWASSGERGGFGNGVFYNVDETTKEVQFVRRWQNSVDEGVYYFPLAVKTVYDPVTNKTVTTRYKWDEVNGKENVNTKFDFSKGIVKHKNVKVITQSNGEIHYEYINSGDKKMHGLMRSESYYNASGKLVSNKTFGYDAYSAPVKEEEGKKYEIWPKNTFYIRLSKESVTHKGVTINNYYSYNGSVSKPYKIVQTGPGINETITTKIKYLNYYYKTDPIAMELFKKHAYNTEFGRITYKTNNRQEKDKETVQECELVEAINIKWKKNGKIYFPENTYLLEKPRSLVNESECRNPTFSADWFNGQKVSSVDNKGNFREINDRGIKQSYSYNYNNDTTIIVNGAYWDEIAVLTDEFQDNWDHNGATEKAAPSVIHFGESVFDVPKGRSPNCEVTSLRTKQGTSMEGTEAYVNSAWVFPKTSGMKIKLNVIGYEESTIKGEVDNTKNKFSSLAINKWHLVKRIIPKEKFDKKTKVVVSISSEDGDFEFEEFRFHPASVKVNTHYYKEGWDLRISSVNENSFGNSILYDDHSRPLFVYNLAADGRRVKMKEYTYFVNSCSVDPANLDVEQKLLKITRRSRFRKLDINEHSYNSSTPHNSVVVPNKVYRVYINSKPVTPDVLLKMKVGQNIPDDCNCHGERFDLQKLSLGNNDFTFQAESRDGTNSTNYTLRISRLANCWVYTGDPEISYKKTKDQHLSIYSSVPYVGYIDRGDRNKVYVAKYNSGNKTWEMLGGNSVSSGRASQQTFGITSSGTLIVTYVDENVDESTDQFNPKYLVGKKYDSGNQKWISLSSRISDREVVLADMAIKGNDVYIAYMERESTGKTKPVEESDMYKLYVKKLATDRLSWDLVGPGSFYNGKVFSLSIDASSQGHPYVALVSDLNVVDPQKDCEDDEINCEVEVEPITENEGSVRVYKYDGSSWAELGDVLSNRSIASLEHPVFIKLDANDMPYVAYTDKFHTDATGTIIYQFPTGGPDPNLAYKKTEHYFLHVKKYDQSSVYRPPYTAASHQSYWHPVVGSANPTAPGILRMEENDFFNFTIDNTTPIVAFSNFQNDNLISVLKFISNKWQSIGNPAFAGSKSSIGNQMGIVHNMGGTTYLAYNDIEQDNTLSVSHFNNTCFDARLASLSITAGGSPVALSWPFRPYILNYKSDVASSVGTVALTAQTKDPSATYKIKVNGQIQTSPLSLEDGKVNHIEVIVTATDGARLTYNVLLKREKVMRPLSEITLKLFGNFGSTYGEEAGEYPMTPTFSHSVFHYSATVSRNSANVRFLADFEDTKYTLLKWNGMNIPTGVISGPIPLEIGTNNVVLQFYNTDTEAYVDYNLIITRSSVKKGIPFRSEDVELPLSEKTHEIDIPLSLNSLTINLLQNGTNTFKINGNSVGSSVFTLPLNQNGNSWVNQLVIEHNDGVITKEYRYLLIKPSEEAVVEVSTSYGPVQMVPAITVKTDDSRGAIDKNVDEVKIHLNFPKASKLIVRGEEVTTQTVNVKTPGVETIISIREITVDGKVNDKKIIITKKYTYLYPKVYVVGKWEAGEDALSGMYKYPDLLVAHSQIQSEINGADANDIPQLGYKIYVITDMGEDRNITPPTDVKPFVKGGRIIPISIIGLKKPSPEYSDLAEKYKNGVIIVQN